VRSFFMVLVITKRGFSYKTHMLNSLNSHWV